MKSIQDSKGSFSIHPITQEDIGAVLEVYRQCEDFLSLGPAATASMEMVQKDIELSQRQGGIFCGIFNTAGVMTGVVDFVLSNFEGDPQAAYLALLMIAKPYRSQGIGKAIAEMVEEEIKNDPKVTKIIAGVQVNNPDALRFWQRQGYQITGGPERMPDQTTVYHLKKDLSRYNSKEQTQGITINQTIHTSLSRVYTAFTTAEGWCAWCCEQAECDPRPGGRLQLYTEGYHTYGVFIELLPDRIATFTWDGDNEPPMLIQVRLEEQAGSTRLTFQVSGLCTSTAWESVTSKIERTWRRLLGNLKDVLDR